MQKNFLNSEKILQHEKIVKKFYSQRHSKIGNKLQAVGWSSKKNQFLRFDLLTRHISKKDNLLDFGCGFGDMHSFLKKKNNLIKYYGYDIYNFKKINSKINFIKQINNKKFDHICCSGVFTLKTKFSNYYINYKLSELFKKCKKSLAINFLSTSSKKKLKKNHYFTASKIIKIIEKLSDNYIIYNNYKLNEITTIILK